MIEQFGKERSLQIAMNTSECLPKCAAIQYPRR